MSKCNRCEKDNVAEIHTCYAKRRNCLESKCCKCAVAVIIDKKYYSYDYIGCLKDHIDKIMLAKDFDFVCIKCRKSLLKGVNMSDTFRKVYKPLHQSNAELILIIKDKFEAIESLVSKVKNREMSLAMTNLEQASMWITKAIVLEDEKNGGNPID